MEPEEMLRILSEQGSQAGSDFNDGDDVMGYFGWSIDGDVLIVTYESGDGSATSRWRLEAV
jgi:hypothetical protein